jgi:hypothetical protein
MSSDLTYLKKARFTDIIKELIDYASLYRSSTCGMTIDEISKAYKKRLNELIGPHLFSELSID